MKNSLQAVGAWLTAGICVAMLMLVCGQAQAAPIAFDLSNLLQTVVIVTIVALIFWALYWFVTTYVKFEPLRTILLVLIALAALVFIINLLLSFIGSPLFVLHH